jgi:hypothetical protein
VITGAVNRRIGVVGWCHRAWWVGPALGRSAAHGPELSEAEGQGSWPRPSLVEAEVDLVGAAGQSGGNVQDLVAEGVDLAAGDDGVVGEAGELRPADQVGAGQDDFEPGVVLGAVVAGQVAQPSRFGLADADFDAGVLAVT